MFNASLVSGVLLIQAENGTFPAFYREPVICAG
jgi:hypothetical protein